MKKMAGTYKYTHDDTGAVYIGSAENIWARHLRHLRPLRIDIAIANEGFENFTFEVLEEFPLGTDRSILRQNERKWIDYYDAENNPLHYNQRAGARPKYSMWDVTKVAYDKSLMFRCNDGNNPRRCFVPRNPVNSSKPIKNIGSFNDPISAEIIYNCVQKWS